MLFNSLTFLIFLPTVFTIYWWLQRWRVDVQNIFLSTVGYIFYGWWDWRFLSLLLYSSLTDYLVGLYLERVQPHRKKWLLGISLVTQIGLLATFKYFNFFADSFQEMLTLLGFKVHPTTIKIVLPVGISFYTFQTLSYTIDVYRGRMAAVRNPIPFFAFVSFFPQLVAGPIERAGALMPQFENKRCFSLPAAKDGLRQMLWGFFKKMVVADNLSGYVDKIFSNYSSLDGPALFLGAFFFAIQIYCDFSGYSDIAVGTARLLGFSLMRNFAYPYFSRDISEFWRRWHISLSTWFRDYVYIPLGGSHISQARTTWNLIITFVISGLWHGANWTYIAWGFLHGIYYVPYRWFSNAKKTSGIVAQGKFFPSATESIGMLTTFVAVVIAWIFFRAPSISHASGYIARMLTVPYLELDHGQYLEPVCYSIIPMIVEWFQREREHGLKIEFMPASVRWAAYCLTIFGIFVLGNFGQTAFIYFQF